MASKREPALTLPLHSDHTETTEKPGTGPTHSSPSSASLSPLPHDARGSLVSAIAYGKPSRVLLQGLCTAVFPAEEPF